MNYADEIKQAIPMAEVASMYGFAQNRSGNICCPFHEDGKPSMHIYSGDRGWWCFVCNEGGDVIDFTRRYFGLSFLDACKKLNADFGLGLPIGEKLTREQQAEISRKAQERKKKQEKLKQTHNALLAAYRQALHNWIYLDMAKRKLAPINPEEPLDDAFAYALANIAEAEYKMDIAADRLWQFESCN